MDRRALDLLLPMLLGLAIAVCAMTAPDAIRVVCVVGGILIGIYYVVLRPRIGTSRRP